MADKKISARSVNLAVKQTFAITLNTSKLVEVCLLRSSVTFWEPPAPGKLTIGHFSEEP